MAARTVKKPEYDGTACMLYDYMITLGLDEESIAEKMRLEKNERNPWHPVSFWIQHPESMRQDSLVALCNVLGAPMEAAFRYSKILNGQDFEIYPRHLTNNVYLISDSDLISELKRRGYKVFKEV